jgi:hypothetical protein
MWTSARLREAVCQLGKFDAALVAEDDRCPTQADRTSRAVREVRADHAG